jgi:hypothetical protein
VGAVFGDEMLAAAILGRLVRHSHTLMDSGRELSAETETEGGLARADAASRRVTRVGLLQQ